jgi:hypothetical protein
MHSRDGALTLRWAASHPRSGATLPSVNLMALLVSFPSALSDKEVKKERSAMRILAYIGLGLMIASSAAALETSAGADTANASMLGINAKIDVSNAALTAVINQMLACNRDGKLFDSSSGECKEVPPGNLDNAEIYNETKTVAVPVSCNDYEKFANCSVSFNLGNYLPAGVSADSVISSIQISWGVNRAAGKKGCNGGPTCPLVYAQAITLPSLSTTVSSATKTFDSGSDSSGNTRYAKTDWKVSNGVVTLTGESCRSTNLYSAAVANVVLKFTLLKIRQSPAS